jgi:LysR family transcriptional regulator (chromosome initiation inhibitor)
MRDYLQLAALAAVLREGSFERAADALHVTPSAVSQRIKQLEDAAGAVLVLRGKPCTATPIGQRFYRHALQVELLESDLDEELARTARARGRAAPPVAIAVNDDSLATWVMPALAVFTRETGLCVKLEVDDEAYTAEWLRTGRVLGAITQEATPVQGCRVEPLGVMRYRATASPAYMRRFFPRGVDHDALQRAPALFYDRRDALETRFVKRVLGYKKVALVAHWIPSSTAFVDAVLLGLGWGINAEPLVHEHLRRGRLVDIVPGKAMEVALFWQHWRIDSTTLSTLTRALTAAAATTLRSTK